jgi:hypothetical protein
MNSKPQSPDDSWKIPDLIFLLLATIVSAWFAGWFTGTSSTGMSPTIVPILFGIASALFVFRGIPGWWILVATIAICLSFMNGVDLGENVDQPLTVYDLLQETNTKVSGEIADELNQMLVVLNGLHMTNAQRNSILTGTAIRIIRDDTLTNKEIIEKLSAFTDRLKK